jgi:hypothetical protein
MSCLCAAGSAFHFDSKLVQTILLANPKAAIIAPETVSGQFNNNTAVAISVNQPYTVGPFLLQFYGGSHANISDGIPVPPNYGVLADNSFYYPGDSFALPENIVIKTLALPVSAPWLKISEVIDFLELAKPEFVFPTHDAILSTAGKEIIDRMLSAATSGQHGVYRRLDGGWLEA